MSNDLQLPQDVKDLLREELKSQSELEKAPSPMAYISIKGKKFRAGDEKLPNELYCVIVVAGYDKTYYASPYDPDSPATPSCFAASIEEIAAPSNNSPEPQSASCLTCPHNVFGSAKIGKGKACKDSRRLIMYSYDKLKSEVDFSQMAQLRVPSSSLKAFSSYVRTVSLRYGLPYLAVVTKIELDQDSDYPSLVFDYDDTLNSDEVLKIMSMKPSAIEAAIKTFSPDEDEEKKPVPLSKPSASQKSKLS